MNDLSDAYKYDQAGDPISAFKYFEKAFSKGLGEIDDYINAAVLMFVCQDYGYASEYKLSKDFVDQAWDESIRFLDLAVSRYGENIEIEFWRKYFKHILLGEISFEDECKNYIDKGNKVSCIHILSVSRNDDPYYVLCEKLSVNLYKSVKYEMNAKEKYIKSVIQKRIKRK